MTPDSPKTSDTSMPSVGTKSIAELETVARQMRKDIVTMVFKAGSGHPGGSLSATDIVAALYFRVMHHNPSSPAWDGRDRFILSKGHASPVIYSALARAGYFPVDDLWTFRRLGSHLQGHTDATMTPGIELSTGSIGMGLSYGVGTALAARIDGKPYHTFVVVGDGESDEGSIWEAAASANHLKLGNITAIIDRNRMQNDGFGADIMNMEPYPDKWRAFGWETWEIDGHDMRQVVESLEKARMPRSHPHPVAIVAHTTKGKGVSFMENNPDWHGKAPTPEQHKQAMEELSK